LVGDGGYYIFNSAVLIVTHVYVTSPKSDSADFNGAVWRDVDQET
jgi:hypothetical protein